MAEGVLEVDMDRAASEAEVDAVRRAFEEAGLPAQVEARIEFRSAFLPPWVIEVTVGTAAIFFAGFASAAGADAWKGLRGLIVKLYRAREAARAPKGRVEVFVREIHEHILFRDGLPDAAYREIVEMQIRQTQAGQVEWDDTNSEWRDFSEVGKSDNPNETGR